MGYAKSENTWRGSALSHSLTILPAVALGMLAMIKGEVSPALWGQQVAVFVVFAILGFLHWAAKRIPSFVWIIMMLMALIVTLFFPSVGGARRWMNLGLFNINVAMLVLPALLLLTSNMNWPYLVMIVAAAVLCLQPDLSQLAAFSLGTLPILWKGRKNVHWTVATIVLIIILAIRCICMPVELEPVAYCEGILEMVGEISPVLLVVGGFSLVFIPCCFTYRFIKTKSMSALCMAIYYAVAILFSITGEYPVPFMGFGLSPIAGYWLASLLIPVDE